MEIPRVFVPVYRPSCGYEFQYDGRYGDGGFHGNGRGGSHPGRRYAEDIPELYMQEEVDIYPKLL